MGVSTLNTLCIAINSKFVSLPFYLEASNITIKTGYGSKIPKFWLPSQQATIKKTEISIPKCLKKMKEILMDHLIDGMQTL